VNRTLAEVLIASVVLGVISWCHHFPSVDRRWNGTGGEQYCDPVCLLELIADDA
jgi:hypothetical protein